MRAPFPVLWLSLCAACSGPGLDKAPSASAALSASDVRAKVQELTAKETATPVAGPGGLQIYKINKGSQVVVAKTNPDGTLTAKCVESASDEFLGGEKGSAQ
ncbi:MAG TPA: hypothetical protein VGH20_07705 [Myxococcales bacterium]|jgi:streptogramin lyase